MFKYGADSGPHAPKAIAGAARRRRTGAKRVAAKSLVIYELNLRGFSRLNPAIPQGARGTFAGLAHPASIAHLAALGVTAVEIMPADPFVDERHLPPLGLANAWGYNSVVFGSPDPRLAPGGWAEVRATTNALHTAGMEAILDVVFNHDGEGDQFGPTLSFRGLDNAAWFRLDPHDPAIYVNDAGTGNCLALDRPLVVDMAIGALRRWMIYGGIDGFRFDLATALGRGPDGFDANALFFQELAKDPVLRQARLIAEPWDLGPGGYRLGAFGPDFAEWNDRFRDAARRFWRGDPGVRGEIATRMAGSRDALPRAAAPSKGVNFIVAHDGFTLADLVSHEKKHNEANGEHNRDGTDTNYSWSHDVEGPTEEPAIVAARALDMRNLLTLLFASHGTPMLAMGAELGFSQGGNNNAYAQDNEITSIRWSDADASLIAFTRRLAEARRGHPALSRDVFLTGEPFDASGLPDVEWRDADGPMTPSAWNDSAGPVLVAVFAAPHDGVVDRVAVAMNRSNEQAELRLPKPRAGMAWRTLVDSHDPAAPERPLSIADRERLRARSCLILAESPAPGGGLRGGPPAAETIDALASAAGIAERLVGRRRKAHYRLARDQDRPPDSARARGEQRGPGARLPRPHCRGDPPPTRPLFAGAARWRSAYHPVARRAEWLGGQDRVRGRENPRMADRRRRGRPDRPPGPPRDRGTDHHAAGPADRPPSADCRGRRELGHGRAGGMLWPGGLRTQTIWSDRTTLCAASRWRSGHRRLFDAGARRRGGRRRRSGLPRREPHAHAVRSQSRAGEPLPSVGPALSRSDPYRRSGPGPAPRRGARGGAQSACAGHRRGLGDEVRRLSRDVDRQARGARGAACGFRPRPSRAARRPDLRRTPGVRRIRRRKAEAVRGVPGDSGERRRRRLAVVAGTFARWRRAGDRGGHRASMARRSTSHSSASGLPTGSLARRRPGRGSADCEIGFYRDLAVGAAPDGAEAWAHAGGLAQGRRSARRPIRSPSRGQNWNLPAPNPLAGAREGWGALSALYAANMRHAGMLRIDHAMGLQRLFLIPDGAKPADGAYLAYPLDDLIGHIALESQSARCMVVGEDLGTVPEGFRARLTRANILGMAVLWFERRGSEILPPAAYPPLSVACVATHDLATLAGWWEGADIAEKLSLGLITLRTAGEAVAERLEEKRGLIAALLAAGLITAAPAEDAPLDDAIAAAVHGLIGRSGSLLASAQFDDLVGETMATNLPGTDHERPNWVSSSAPTSPLPSPATGRGRSWRRWRRGGRRPPVAAPPPAPVRCSLSATQPFQSLGRQILHFSRGARAP